LTSSGKTGSKQSFRGSWGLFLKYYSLMLLPEKGAVKNFRIYRFGLLIALFSSLGFVSFGLWGMNTLKAMQILSKELEQTQSVLAQTRVRRIQDVEHLQTQLALEQEKMTVYARNIGQMEARLMRLDSLGKHLVEASLLDKTEFNFETEPAMGGPLLGANVTDHSLSNRVQGVTGQLADLDTQLAAIDLILEDNREGQQARPHAWPSQGGWLSSRFGLRNDPFTGKPAHHMGIDIANKLHAPVLAASRGVVSFSGRLKGYGYLIEVDHGYGYQTRYGHMSKIHVHVGDEVTEHQLLGDVGSSGRSTGPHLHFEVRRFGIPMDPQKFLDAG